MIEVMEHRATKLPSKVSMASLLLSSNCASVLLVLSVTGFIHFTATAYIIMGYSILYAIFIGHPILSRILFRRQIAVMQDDPVRYFDIFAYREAIAGPPSTEDFICRHRDIDGIFHRFVMDQNIICAEYLEIRKDEDRVIFRLSL